MLLKRGVVMTDKHNKLDCIKCRSVTKSDCQQCSKRACPHANINDGTLYDLAELFKVFGDSTRIRIISALMDGEMCVYHLAERLNVGQSAVSHQLRILRSAGLVRPRREGKEIYYSLDDEHVEEIYSAGLAHILHKNHIAVAYIAGNKEVNDE